MSGRRIRTLSSTRGAYVKAKVPRERIADIALDATLRAAAPYARSRTSKGKGMKIESQDIREKVKIGKISTPTVFVVDASGSMFTSDRMECAKGAIFSMLIDSYQKRDKVGMVIFREHKAQVVLPVCLSLDWAIECLNDVASGGPTPLSAGLEKGLEMLLLEKRKNREAIPILVLISDGRANVPLTNNSDIHDELIKLTDQAWINKIYMIFIDVEQNESEDSSGRNRKQILMNRMTYYHVDQLTSDLITDVVAREKEIVGAAFS